MSTGPTGVMVIRVWLEHGSAAPLRATVRCTLDIESGVEHVVTVSDTADVVAAVEAWLRDVCGDGEPRDLWGAARRREPAPPAPDDVTEASREHHALPGNVQPDA